MKTPEERLSWPHLLTHAFVKDGVKVENKNDQFSLTRVLSPSQELAKEHQRQNLERKLANYSQYVISVVPVSKLFFLVLAFI